jgi:hypothetical protein
MVIEIAVIAVASFASGVAFSLWLAARWVGTALGDKFREEIDAGRLTREEAIRLSELTGYGDVRS